MGHAMSDTAKSATGGGSHEGFTAEERAAMKERAKELRAEARRGERDAKAREQGEADLREKIDEMSGNDRDIAEHLHALVADVAPDLMPKTWYGQPAWARDGQIICFFQPAEKFGSRYPTLGFNDPAKLDDGTMWPTSFALTEWNAANESTIRALVARAAS